MASTLISSQPGTSVLVGSQSDPTKISIVTCNGIFRRMTGLPDSPDNRHGKTSENSACVDVGDNFLHSQFKRGLLGSITKHQACHLEVPMSRKDHQFLTPFFDLLFHPTSVFREFRYGCLLIQEHLTIRNHLNTEFHLFSLASNCLTNLADRDSFQTLLKVLTGHFFADAALLWTNDPKHDVVTCLTHWCDPDSSLSHYVPKLATTLQKTSSFKNGHSLCNLQIEAIQSPVDNPNDQKKGNRAHGSTLKRPPHCLRVRLPLTTLTGQLVGVLELLCFKSVFPFYDNRAMLEEFGLLLGTFIHLRREGTLGFTKFQMPFPYTHKTYRS
ncbi:MAG: hypothetical protein MRJ96_08100 [Nitrospirales bacterium]|nr:hypothetical protein [Nitrospirales bacterium]